MTLFDDILGKIAPILDTKFGELIKEMQKVNANINKLREELKQAGVLK